MMNILVSNSNALICEAIANYLIQQRASWKVTTSEDIEADYKRYDLIIADVETLDGVSGKKYIRFNDQSGRRLLYEIERKQGGNPYAFHAATFQSLSSREREVLIHLGQGASNKDIAHALHLQVATIKLHVRGVCKKLGASNRTQAALMAQYLSLH
jgi:ATP/maltotriose-dependent transcriptional regulator MalT